MGNTFALDLATSTLGLRNALSIHLTSNHYPPVPAEMIEPCVLAIEAMNDEDDRRDIDLPEGVLWRGQTTAPAWAIVEGHHLESWLSQDGE
jgi:hypothetical protein